MWNAKVIVCLVGLFVRCSSLKCQKICLRSNKVCIPNRSMSGLPEHQMFMLWSSPSLPRIKHPPKKEEGSTYTFFSTKWMFLDDFREAWCFGIGHRLNHNELARRWMKTKHKQAPGKMKRRAQCTHSHGGETKEGQTEGREKDTSIKKEFASILALLITSRDSERE